MASVTREISELEMQEIWNRLKRHEEKIARVEKYLNLDEQIEEKTDVHFRSIEEIEQDENLEYKIGQYWFAKIGIIAFIIGIIFFLLLPLEDIPKTIPVFSGFICAGVFLLLPKLIGKNVPHLVNYLTGGSVILLYFSIVRLHFTGAFPIIHSIVLELVLLNAVFLFSIILALRSKSQSLSFISVVIGFASAILSNSAYYTFLWICLVASVSVYINLKYNWRSLLGFAILLAYCAHAFWFINFPAISNTVEIIVPKSNFIFLFLYFLIFSSAYFIERGEKSDETSKVINNVLNVIMFYLLLLAITLNGSYSSFSIIFGAASIIFLLQSAYYWKREKSKYLTFLFAMSGYLALSTSILYQFNFANSLILLCWQSLIVISTAVWYKSRIIIVANFFIYLLIFIVYLTAVKNMTVVSLSFGIAALVSARILNWKKKSLDLKTERMRNSYLLLSLLFIPFALFEIIPSGYIAVSWVTVAVFYYLFSLLLKNRKYRWMAVLTLLMTIIYVSVLGLTSSELIYKIMSFLILGSVLISISFIYGRMKRRQILNNKKIIV